MKIEVKKRENTHTDNVVPVTTVYPDKCADITQSEYILHMSIHKVLLEHNFRLCFLQFVVDAYIIMGAQVVHIFSFHSFFASSTTRITFCSLFRWITFEQTCFVVFASVGRHLGNRLSITLEWRMKNTRAQIPHTRRKQWMCANVYFVLISFLICTWVSVVYVNAGQLDSFCSALCAQILLFHGIISLNRLLTAVIYNA